MTFAARRRIFVLLGLAVFALGGTPPCAAAERANAWGDFSLDLCKTLTPENHWSVGSGWSAVQPAPETVMGVGAVFAPPLACSDLRVSIDLVVDGQIIPDARNLGKGDVGLLYAGGAWQPERIVRRGTYHQLRSGRLVSLGVESRLIPLFHRGGFLLTATVTNRTGRTVTVQWKPQVVPGGPSIVPLGKWGFGIPRAGLAAQRVADDVWSNGQASLQLFTESCTQTLPPHSAGVAYVAMVGVPAGQTVDKPARLADWEEETSAAWRNRRQWALHNVPTLETDLPGLADYYRRSVLSGLVCLWENPAFAVNPHVATCGIDGGGLCTYLWDTGGYSAGMVALLLGEKCRPILEQMSRLDLSRHYAFSLDGTGVGCGYSYSPLAFTRLVWTLARYEGADQRLFEMAQRLVFDAEKKYPAQNGLLDYGRQHNLLEMRGIGYEHFVPSPNAERAWCFERLADLGTLLKQPPQEIQAWRDKAAAIRTAVKRQLWDPQCAWFKCLQPNGRAEHVYSIQMFDVLRAMPHDAEICHGLLAHLRPGAFLADYGVQSVSREDAVHFEVIDTDWSGGGAYVGDGAELAQTLYEIGQPERAWDVLQRFFWMGKHLLYYPQEMYADRPAVPAHKRANSISGTVGAQTILYGLVGFDPRPDGSLWLKPQPPRQGTIAVHGYRAHGHCVDVDIRDGECRVVCDGAEVYRGPAKPTCITSGRASANP